jgi:hypothetical protein
MSKNIDFLQLAVGSIRSLYEFYTPAMRLGINDSGGS